MQAKPEQVPLPQDEPNAEVEVDNADLDFVSEFKGSLGFLESLTAKQLDKQVQKGPAKKRAKQAHPESDSDSETQGPEAAYERAPRQRLQDQQLPQKSGLPTKNLHGELVYCKAKSSKHDVVNIQVANDRPLPARYLEHHSMYSPADFLLSVASACIAAAMAELTLFSCKLSTSSGLQQSMPRSISRM